MLKIIRNWEKQDYLRDLQGNRGYGLQIANNIIPLQIQGAYADNERVIEYLFAQQINDKMEIVETFILDVNLLDYTDGQWHFVDGASYGGYLDEGVYFFEFNDGYENYFSEIFKAQEIIELDKASSSGYASESSLVSSLNVETNGFYQRLKTFSESFGFVEYAD